MITKNEQVRFPHDDTTLRGYLAAPTAERPAPAVLLIPDVRGIYPHFEAVARRFAKDGFVTLVLDLYSREGAPDLPDMEAVVNWMRSLPDARVLGDIAAAIGYLAEREEVNGAQIGVVGFCMGGQYALMAACVCEGLAACVSWYGMLRYTHPSAIKPADALTLASGLRVPYLGLFGADDPLIPAGDVAALKTILQTTEKTFEIREYAGAGHAFFNDTRTDMYRRETAEQSWREARAFLRRRLCSTSQDS